MEVSREHYIPVRPADLVRKLADDPAVTIFDRRQFLDLAELTQSIIHHECHARLQRLLACYARFHPDEPRPGENAAGNSEAAEREKALAVHRIFDEFDGLLKQANYRRLSREEIESAIQSPTASGLRLILDLSIFDRLDVYVRGDCQIPAEERIWWQAPKIRDVPAYRRLALIFRLKRTTPRTNPLGTDAVVLKLFKDIPRDNLEVLLPGSRVQIGMFERAKIVLPTVSGIALTLLKLLKGAAALTFASLYGLAAFLGLVGGAVGYGVKSFFSYLSIRERHQLSLTRQLYYQNLDNNAGVIYHLLAEAEEQEFREFILGYWLLWRGSMSGATEDQIDKAAERWLYERCGLVVDFEVADALGKLERLGLAFKSPTGRWRAIAIEEALERLDRYWDEQFDYRRTAKEQAQASQPRLYRRAA